MIKMPIVTITMLYDVYHNVKIYRKKIPGSKKTICGFFTGNNIRQPNQKAPPPSVVGLKSVWRY